MSTSEELESLALLVVAFCQDRKLDLDCYVEGLVSGGPFSGSLVRTLIRYHEEWVR